MVLAVVVVTVVGVTANGMIMIIPRSRGYLEEITTCSGSEKHHCRSFRNVADKRPRRVLQGGGDLDSSFTMFSSNTTTICQFSEEITCCGFHDAGALFWRDWK